MATLDNAKHELFAQWLAKGLGQLASYVEAGFKANASGASKLAKNAQVKARVAELLERAASEAQVDTEWVIERLKRNAERCMQAEQALDLDGEPTGEYHWEPQAANKALELLGKNTGAWAKDNEQRKPEGGVATVIMYPRNERD